MKWKIAASKKAAPVTQRDQVLDVARLFVGTEQTIADSNVLYLSDSAPADDLQVGVRFDQPLEECPEGTRLCCLAQPAHRKLTVPFFNELLTDANEVISIPEQVVRQFGSLADLEIVVFLLQPTDIGLLISGRRVFRIKYGDGFKLQRRFLGDQEWLEARDGDFPAKTAWALESPDYHGATDVVVVRIHERLKERLFGEDKEVSAALAAQIAVDSILDLLMGFAADDEGEYPEDSLGAIVGQKLEELGIPQDMLQPERISNLRGRIQQFVGVVQ